jgi:hypothetical protein
MSRVPPTLSHKARIWRGAIPGTHEPGFIEQPIRERDRDAEFVRIRQIIAQGREIDLYAFSMGECNILLGREPGGVNGEMRWHLTISCPDRHPSWDEIKTARYRLLGPDTVMAMILPPVADYVNVASQDHVMQLWEIEDAAQIWSAE